MVIRVDVNHISKSKQKEYPYIGVWGEYVILFTAPKKGTLLKTVQGLRVGDSVGEWAEPQYTPLNGSITLTQEV